MPIHAVLIELVREMLMAWLAKQFLCQESVLVEDLMAERNLADNPLDNVSISTGGRLDADLTDHLALG